MHIAPEILATVVNCLDFRDPATLQTLSSCASANRDMHHASRLINPAFKIIHLEEPSEIERFHSIIDNPLQTITNHIQHVRLDCSTCLSSSDPAVELAQNIAYLCNSAQSITLIDCLLRTPPSNPFDKITRLSFDEVQFVGRLSIIPFLASFSTLETLVLIDCLYGNVDLNSGTLPKTLSAVHVKLRRYEGPSIRNLGLLRWLGANASIVPRIDTFSCLLVDNNHCKEVEQVLTVLGPNLLSLSIVIAGGQSTADGFLRQHPVVRSVASLSYINSQGRRLSIL